MLVLTRYVGESIWIGDIKLTILGNGYGKVKVGIDAPDDVNIVREELLEDDDPRADQ